MIRGLSDQQVEAMIDVKIGDAGTDSQKYGPMSVLLARWETINNDNHRKNCNKNRK